METHLVRRPKSHASSRRFTDRSFERYLSQLPYGWVRPKITPVMDGETPDARVGGIRYGSCCVLRQVERLSLHAIMLNHRSEKILLT